MESSTLPPTKTTNSHYSAISVTETSLKNQPIGSNHYKKNGKPVLYTDVCPNGACTGRFEDIFDIFLVICRNEKHEGGRNLDLRQNQRTQSNTDRSLSTTKKEFEQS